MAATLFKGNFTCWKCEGNIGEGVEQEEWLCDEVETERESIYLGDKFRAGGGCVATVTVITRNRLVMFMWKAAVWREVFGEGGCLLELSVWSMVPEEKLGGCFAKYREICG